MTVDVNSPERAPATVTPPPPPPTVKASVLLAVLGIGGAVAGILLVVAYGITLPRIEANRAHALHLAVNEVLKAPEHYDTLYVTRGGLVKEPPAGVDARTLERVYLGYAANGQRVGFAVVAGEAGFQDVITLIFGYDARERKLLAMKVLESKETPGLGDKIEKDHAFVSQFGGLQPPLAGVKQTKRAKPGDVEMITGATISSRAVIRIINNALERVGPLLEAYPEDRTR